MVKDKKQGADINAQSIWKYHFEIASKDPSRLNKTAIFDCSREYTYRQMYEEWERYARVFSALGMTEENSSRVGIGGTISAEPLFAFYGLNMTGAAVSMMSYPDFLPMGQWENMVQKEKITDLILSDIMVTPDTWPQIEAAKEKYGVRNIILLHSRLGGPCTGPAELVYNEVNYHMLKKVKETVFMDDLLTEYAQTPITYGSGNPDNIAVITHTSGTTKGTRKPLPFTDRAVNTTATQFADFVDELNGGKKATNQQIISPSFDFSSYMCMSGIVNHYLVDGNSIVLTFFGFLHPKFVRAVKYYKLTVVFASGFMVDSWMKRNDIPKDAFASVKTFSCGGSYLPIDKLKQYNEFVKSHGYKGNILRGYGMSEAGGSQLMVPDGCMEDILGYPHPVEDFYIKDSDDGKFYTARDGVRTGIMYMSSNSLCTNVLDGEVLFEFTKINGRNFVCTNDLVRVNVDGSFSYGGRGDRYFVNNDGVKFDAGSVETMISRCRGIDQCAVVPVLDKRIHDTVPVLYVVAGKGEADRAKIVKDALYHVFIDEKLINKSIMPSQFVLVDSIPANANGKIDIYRITRERLMGDTYDIVPVKNGDKLIDVDYTHNEKAASITGGTLPEGMDGRSAFNLFDLFNS